MSASGSITFFIDNNLSPQLAIGMRGFGEAVEHLQDLFNEDADDTEWLQYVGRRGLVLITRDISIRRRPAELAALRDHRVGAFFLGGKNLGRCDLIQQLVRNWPRMKQMSIKTRRPFAFRVPPRGTKFVSIPL